MCFRKSRLGQLNRHMTTKLSSYKNTHECIIVIDRCVRYDLRLENRRLAVPARLFPKTHSEISNMSHVLRVLNIGRALYSLLPVSRRTQSSRRKAYINM